MNWISVSDIAILTGNNKYQTNAATIKKYKNKYSSQPELIKPDDPTHVEIIQDKIEKLIPNLTENISISNSNEIVEQIINTPQFIEEVGDISVSKIKAVVQSHVYKSHGKKYEDHVYDWLKNESGLDGEFSDLQKGQGKNIGFIDDIRWRIYGKVDGLYVCRSGTKYVLEIKNRQNRLFDSVPIYEKIQVQAYMYIFNIKYAIVVQHYNNQYKLDYLEFDKSFIMDIIDNLIDVIKNDINTIL